MLVFAANQILPILNDLKQQTFIISHDSMRQLGGSSVLGQLSWIKWSRMDFFKYLMVGRLVVLEGSQLGLVISASNVLSFSSRLAQASSLSELSVPKTRTSKAHMCLHLLSHCSSQSC